MSVVSLKEKQDARLDRAWSDYLVARERAERSGALTDGIMAGKAWGRWLRMFEPSPAHVIPMPRRGR